MTSAHVAQAASDEVVGSSSLFRDYLLSRSHDGGGSGHARRGQRMAKESVSLLQRLSLVSRLDEHRGCVNSVCWNASGTWLLSGSDDHRLIVTEPWSGRVIHSLATSHRANIFSARFLPGTGDAKLVSCAGDGTLLYSDLERVSATHDCQFNCHSGTTYELLTIPDDSHTFMSCGEDGTVRWFDLRTKEKCQKSHCNEDVLISCGSPVASISLNPRLPHQLAVGASDATVRIFDRRMLSSPGGARGSASASASSLQALLCRFSVPALAGKQRRITSVDFRPDGQEVLVSYSSDYIYIFDALNSNPNPAKRLFVGRGKPTSRLHRQRMDRSPPPMKRLRLRGDWSDTGPNARPDVVPSQPTATVPEAEAEAGVSAATTETSGTTAAAATLPETSNSSDGDESMLARRGQGSNSPPPLPVAGGAGAGADSGPRGGAAASVADTAGQQGNLMQRMTDALSRMLNDPSTRLAMRSLQSTRERQLSGEADGERQGGNQVQTASSEGGGGGGGTNLNLAEVTTAESTGETATEAGPTLERRGIHSLQQSISSMRENYLDRHHSEPEVNLRYRSQGVESSSVSMPAVFSPTEAAPATASASASASASPLPASERSERPDDPGTGTGADWLPGPSQVVTDAGPSLSLTEQQHRLSSDNDENDNDDKDMNQANVHPPLSQLSDSYGSSESNDDQIFEFEEEDGMDEEELKQARLIPQPLIVRKFTGHRNARTMIKEATWWGTDFVLSGSDCGHVFGWHRDSGRLVLLLEADRHVVNCVQPHPFDPVLATSGIDHNVKVWAPTKDEVDFDREAAETLMRRNEVMLEETRDTITVPAALMIRMLASLNQIRRAGRLTTPRGSERRRERDTDEGDEGDGEEEAHPLNSNSQD